ncbi:MAG TPA: cytochrome P450 [Pyrinomonadaceae bacterium]|jgi:Cytochrome P450|nr:cytochrome P450 [Pyrinomonadaceae bacterium]
MKVEQQISTVSNGRSELPLPPGPKGHFILGVMREFNNDTLGFISRCRDFGDVVRARFLYVHAYFLFNPSDIETLLTTDAKNYRKAGSLRSPFFARLVGNGLVTSEGEFWRRQRRLAQPAFHRQRINSYAEVMVDYAGRSISRWREGEELDISRDMTRLTLEIVVKTLFNADVSKDADHVGATLSQLVKPFASQATLKWILDNRLPTPAHRRYFNAVSEIDRIVFRIISERRASRSDEGDLLSMLLQAQDDDGSQMTDAQLRDEVMTLFLAGHETTALALSWSWYLLATNPSAEKKFHEELHDVLQGRAPTVNDLTRLTYTEMIAKETMRLYPPAYAVGREALEETEIGGFRVPKGSQVFAFQWVTQRDKRYFEDPDDFDPERWRPERTEQLPKYAYFPFGGGPRQCIGNYFAMMEIVLLLATIGQRFRFSLTSDHKVEVLPALSLRPRNGIKVIPERRIPATIP